MNILKSKWVLIILAISGIALICFSNIKTADKLTEDDSVTYYSKEVEGRIEALILEMESIENVKVLISLENNGETVYAQNEKGESFEYVIYNDSDGEKGLKLEEINPKVRGVAVVCTNGDNIKVKEKIVSILSSVLDLPTNRITVTN